MDMTKFDAANGPGYRAVSTMLWRWSKSVQDEVAKSSMDSQVQRDSNGKTPLHLAVTSGNFDMVTLLEKGANPNARDNDGRTPLHDATACGEIKAVSVLLEYNTKVDATDNELRTPLHLAAFHGRATILEKLLENGAQIDKKDHVGKTADEVATEHGHKIIVQLIERFRRAQLSPHQQAELDTKLVFAAGRRANLKAVESYIHQGADVNNFSRETTALHYAASCGDEAIVRLLLEKGSDVNVKNSFEMTPLDEAAQKGYESLVKLLFRDDASISNAIAFACSGSRMCIGTRRRHIAVVLFFLDTGLCTNNDKDRALLIAADGGDLSLVKLLLERGADIHTKSLPKTPLICAVQCINLPVVLFLLGAGADVEAKDTTDRTALIVAAAAPSRGYVGNNQLETVKALLEYGADVSAADKNGNTAMHMAAQCGGFEVVDILRRKGADLNMRNQESKTPLELARSRGKDRVVSLIEAAEGTNIHGDGKHGLTALQRAVSQSLEPVVEVLLEREVDVDIKHYGETALHMAATRIQE
jgi:ankyrin repeat protein